MNTQISKTKWVSKTLFGAIESVLLIFSVSIRNLCARRISPSKTVLQDGSEGFFEKRLADKPRIINGLGRQQDGKTLSLSKKGHIHVRARARIWGRVSKKSVLRLAGAFCRSAVVGDVGIADAMVPA